jgi:hypothetical protein
LTVRLSRLSVAALALPLLPLVVFTHLILSSCSACDPAPHGVSRILSRRLPPEAWLSTQSDLATWAVASSGSGMAKAARPIHMREGFQWKEGGQGSRVRPVGQVGPQPLVRLHSCAVMTHGSSWSCPYREAGSGGGMIYDDPRPGSPGQLAPKLSLGGLTWS